jgi:hypothetical protein
MPLRVLSLLAALIVTVAPAGLPAQVVEDLPPDVESAPGQQHWVGVNLSLFQPTVARLQVAVAHRPACTWLAEVYAGSELVDFMAGGGVRVQFTVSANARGDALLVSPGIGVHFLPRSDGFVSSAGPEEFAAADADISWVHDFSERFGYEVGVKLGLAGRLAGSGDRPLMFSKDWFPLVNVFSGFRF